MTTEEQAPYPGRWRALAVTLAAGFMSLLDVSIVNVALPAIQRGLPASAEGAQWVVSGYALTFGLSLVAGGRLGDVLGRRRMFLLALTAFVLTSAAAGAAPNELLLVAARLAQGLAAGLLAPQNSGLIQEMFRGAERGRAFGMLGSTIGIATAAGPVFGGLLISTFGEQTGWRWVFYVNVPIGVLALVLAMKLVPKPERKPESVRARLDFVGAGLLGLTVLGVLLPLVQSEQGSTPLSWLPLPLAGLLGWLFLRWERRLITRDRTPLLDVRLFTQAAGFTRGISLGTVYFCGFSGIWLVLSLFFQDGLGYSALESGLSVTPFAVGSAVTAVVAGRLVTRWGRVITVTGLALISLGLGAGAVVLALTGGRQAGLALIVPLLVAGVGGGAVVSPNITLTLARVPTRMAGSAGGALQTGQRIGTAVGTAVLAFAYRGTLTGTHGHYPIAATTALLCSVGFMLAAMALAVLELRANRGRHRSTTDAADELAHR
ncbi:MAG TPA: MFS transporter [Pseudonocardiaceae bacterium]|nr:MFS transporter [Pseudonocardiaceae bacterium]